MRAFAVVAGDEKFAFGNGEVDFARSDGFGAVVFGEAPFFVVNETVGMFCIVDGHGAVFDDDAFAWESDDAFDDVLIADATWDAAGERI